ncbi:hypothetical protein BOTBODRAFT_66569 [Botryobasidium botryosum FD-172 SS1]|uniref:CCHC-type domain-containing protein n=1 Tax=Botryobasidium botryosum (strain FD-172 SS1) TaxID=930990 RepID=A0A067MPV0_BOTB1|nr:hypothetical protein BOTBODRAFT_66569 [Botryobasidium botryosum FD-172 SS1]
MRVHVPNNDRKFPGRQLEQITSFGTSAIFEVHWKTGDHSWEPYHAVWKLAALESYCEAFGITAPSKLPKGTAIPPNDPQIFVGSIFGSENLYKEARISRNCTPVVLPLRNMSSRFHHDKRGDFTRPRHGYYGPICGRSPLHRGFQPHTYRLYDSVDTEHHTVSHISAVMSSILAEERPPAMQPLYYAGHDHSYQPAPPRHRSRSPGPTRIHLDYDCLTASCRLTHDELDTHRRDGRCFHCHQQGHRGSDCASKNRRVVDQDMIMRGMSATPVPQYSAKPTAPATNAATIVGNAATAVHAPAVTVQQQSHPTPQSTLSFSFGHGMGNTGFSYNDDASVFSWDGHGAVPTFPLNNNTGFDSPITNMDSRSMVSVIPLSNMPSPSTSNSAPPPSNSDNLATNNGTLVEGMAKVLKLNDEAPANSSTTSPVSDNSPSLSTVPQKAT